jgi:hypothetical protein
MAAHPPPRISDPFRSARLVYRAIDMEKDVEFYYQMGLDSVAQMQWYNGLPKVCAL